MRLNPGSDSDWADTFPCGVHYADDGPGGDRYAKCWEMCFHAPFFTDGQNITSKIVFVREPRAHVLSQFLECKYDVYGSKDPVFLRFAGSKEAKADVYAGFEQWLGHFTGQWDPADGDFDCYNPLNMQARHLVCKGEGLPDGGSGFADQAHHAQSKRAPPISIALAAIDHPTTIPFVTEYYQESLCLFMYRAGYPTATVPSFCNCEDRKAWQSFRSVHIRHGVPAKHDIKRLPQRLLDGIDSITRVDQNVYLRSIRRLQIELRQMQEETGIQVMCDKS